MADTLTSARPHKPRDQSFFTAREILTVNPWTPDDFRRILTDLEGVRNAWVFCKECACDAEYYAWCEDDRLNLSFVKPKKAGILPIKVSPRGLYDILLELEESLVLCDTGSPHESGDIHQDQRKHMQQEDVRKKVQSNVELTYRIRNHLLRGRLLQFGQCLHEAWQFKRQFSDKITTPRLDGIYSLALENGAVGGKLLGAGGGGFFLFYATPFRKHEVIQKLEGAGLSVRPFRFEPEGLRAWSAREKKHQVEMSPDDSQDRKT